MVSHCLRDTVVHVLHIKDQLHEEQFEYQIVILKEVSPRGAGRVQPAHAVERYRPGRNCALSRFGL